MTCGIITLQGQDISDNLVMHVFRNDIFSVYSHWFHNVLPVILFACVALFSKYCFYRSSHLLSILCILGGSSGTAAYVAMQACKDFGLTKDQRCVVLLPDSIRNYMSVDFVKIILQINNTYQSSPSETMNKIMSFSLNHPAAYSKMIITWMTLYNNAFWLLLISY